MPKTYTVKQVAQALGFSTNTVYKYLDEGKIQATRLGKEGRFRIPEGEVIRLLGLKGKQAQIAPQIEAAQAQEQVPQIPSLVTQQPIRAEEIIQKLTVPSLFDWFVATLAIFVGFSHLLFPAYVLDIKAAPFVEYIKFIKIALIFGGVALLATDVFRPTRKIWHHLLHLCLGLLFGTLAYISFQLGFYPRMLGDGAIALLLLTTALIHISDRARFMMLVDILAAVAGMIFLAYPQSTNSPALSDWISQNKLTFGVIYYGLVSTLVLWNVKILKGKRGLICWIGVLLVAAGSFSAAFFNLQSNLWEDTVYAVVFGSFVLILPFWHQVRSVSAVSKRELFLGFGLMVTMFAIGIGLVFYLQTTFKDYVLSENQKRVKNAVLLVEQYLEESEKAVSGFAKDESLLVLISSSKKDKLDDINQIIKRFFLASSTLRRIGVIDEDGKGLVLYPEDSFFGLDLTDRDYFKQAKETKRVVISDVLEPKVPGIKTAVVIAAPLLDEEGEFIGLIFGSVDFVKLANKLAGFKGTNTNFVIADRNKNILFHPDESQLLKPISVNNVVLQKAVEGQSGELESYSNLGKLNLASFTHIEKLGWGIVIQEPLAEALKHQSAVSFVIFLVTVVLGVGSLLTIIYLKKREI